MSKINNNSNPITSRRPPSLVCLLVERPTVDIIHLHDECLVLSVMLHSCQTILSPNARHLVASKRQFCRCQVEGVDIGCPSLKLANNPVSSCHVLGEHSSSKAKISVVCSFNCFFFCIKNKNRCYSTKYLLLDSLHVIRAVREYSRAEIPAICTITLNNHSLTTTGNCCTLTTSRLHITKHFLGMVLIDCATNSNVIIHGVTNFHLFGLFDKLFQEFIINPSLNKDTCPIRANLALGQEVGHKCTLDSILEVGIIKDK